MTVVFKKGLVRPPVRVKKEDVPLKELLIDIKEAVLIALSLAAVKVMMMVWVEVESEQVTALTTWKTALSRKRVIRAFIMKESVIAMIKMLNETINRCNQCDEGMCVWVGKSLVGLFCFERVLQKM